ncbi:MAG: FUSC family protein [Spartobacteria bacterium]|nr:FUSC family protein [Spartobacteria bacterium]
MTSDFLSVNPGTRLGIQLAISFALIELLGFLFHIERSYWAMFAATSVLCQTWGDSLRKGLYRLLHTATGFTFGLFLYHFFHWNQACYGALIFAGIFVMSYFSSTSYPITMFCMSFSVAIMFGIMGILDPQLVMLRVLQTFIGVAIAILAGRFITPIRSQNLLKADILHFMSLADKQLRRLMTLDKPYIISDLKEEDRMAPALHTLRLHYRIYARETSVLRPGYRRGMRYAVIFEDIANLLISLESCRTETENIPELIEYEFYIATCRDIVSKNMKILSSMIESDGKTPASMQTLEAEAQTITEKMTPHIQSSRDFREKSRHILPFFYYSKRINQILIWLSEQKS